MRSLDLGARFDGERRLGPMPWGFVPSSAKDPRVARDRWLDPTAGEAELRGFLVPLPAEDLEAYEVSTLVNLPRNDSPECVKPIG